ncbi:MAG: molybdopterin-dependent oxidoreductase [Deltaproteobacteria bacterium]|nr:molybdopterin-dependent oxidoreductase [Deltaproteobacteria bacterium]
MSNPKQLTLTRRAALGSISGATLLDACARWKDPKKDSTGHSLVKPYVPGSEAFFTHEERWLNTSCDQCPAACGIRVRVVEGRAVRIEGNASNPVNQGGIGARGLSGLQALYDADRVRSPMKREGSRWVPITWDEGIDQLARALSATRKASSDQLLVISGRERGFTHELLHRFCRAFGTPNFVDGRSSHTAAITHAMAACLGVSDSPAIEWEGADFILSLEAALFEDSCRSVYMARAAGTMRRDRARRVHLVHAGPAFDLAAYNADRWMRLQPGTSGALALGICNSLLLAGTYDHDFVDHADGIDEFRGLVSKFTPERVASVTGLDAKAAPELAGMLWARRPSLVVVDERSLSFTNGAETAAAVLALNAMLGSVQRSGCGIRVPPVAPLLDWPEVYLDEVAERGVTQPSLDRAGTRFPKSRSVLDALPEAILAKPPAVALLYYSNPTYARPQPRRWKDALSKVPLVVSFSPFLDETVEDVAHLVLPDHTYLERTEEALPSPNSTRSIVGVRRAVVTPLFDTRATGEVILQLANRVGGAVRQAFPWRSHREAVEARLLGLQAASRGSIVEETPTAFLRELLESGFWCELESDPIRTTSFQFQPSWEPPQFDGDPAEYPFTLLAYRPLGYAEGSGANQPWLRTLRPRPGTQNWTLAVSVNPADLAFPAEEGEIVRIESPYGAIEVPLLFDARMQRGCLAIPLGGGHRAYGRWARGFSANVMAILRAAPAPDTGASLLAATRVRIKPSEVT